MKDKMTKHNKKMGHFIVKRFFLAFSIIFLIGLSIAVPVTMAMYRSENNVALLNKTNVENNQNSQIETE